MSTIKVDDELKNELTRIQSSQDDGSFSYNEIVWNAIRKQKLLPILIQYLYSKVSDWNPYDVLTWYYDEEKIPLDQNLVEAYAQLIVETSDLRGSNNGELE